MSKGCWNWRHAERNYKKTFRNWCAAASFAFVPQRGHRGRGEGCLFICREGSDEIVKDWLRICVLLREYLLRIRISVYSTFFSMIDLR